MCPALSPYKARIALSMDDPRIEIGQELNMIQIPKHSLSTNLF
jgi:hypothetical protein